MTTATATMPRYGFLAEFEEPERLLSAVRRVREAGYRQVDAYVPFPMEELPEALGMRRTRMPLVVLLGGITGGVCGYLLQYWAWVINYPINIGGRPPHSWPAFVPVTFEMTILFAALAAVFGMLARNGLPQPHHPLFAVPEFARATQDRFFLCIRADDPKFAEGETWKLLEDVQADQIFDVRE